MKIVETTIEPHGPDSVRIVTIIDLAAEREPASGSELGEGPTGDAVPDRIVRYLIERAPDAVTLADIQTAVGGNQGTVNRQAWTLANNAPDLQHRLRGWVQSTGRGRYALTDTAKRHLSN